MIVGRVLSPVHSLGPGERVCVWTQGCQRKCNGCISPELQGRTGNDIDNYRLAHLVQIVAEKGNCNGLTISGGEPFEQAESLLEILKPLRSVFSDILVYTGFTLEEILSGDVGKEGIECLQLIDVLIDGPYVKELNRPDCVLRGSTNQTIHFLNKEKEQKYLAYMSKGRIIESFIHNNSTILTGIINEVEL